MYKRIRTACASHRRVILVMLFCFAFVGLHGGLVFSNEVALAYAEKSCVGQVHLFPGLHRQTRQEQYKTELVSGLTVANLRLASSQVCVTPQSAPTEGATKLRIAPFGGILFAKTYSIIAGKPPVPDTTSLSRQIPVDQHLDIPLSFEDRIFTYELHAAKKVATCTPRGEIVSCDVPALELKQGQEYQALLVRHFKGQNTVTLSSEKIKTLAAVNITKTPFRQGDVVYEKPNAIEFTTDKPLAQAELTAEIKNGDERLNVAGSVNVAGDKVTFRFEKELARSTAYEVTLKNVRATDGSSMESPYVFTFSTSGGPKISKINIGKSGVAPGETVIITFDQPLASGQDWSRLLTISGVQKGSFSQTGDRVRFQVVGGKTCQDFSVSLKGQVESVHEVSEALDWSHTSRLRCYTTTIIGYSVSGAPLVAYVFGSGEASVLYVGATHGNERSSGLLMDAWIGELDANAHAIPANRTVVVIPRVNPDAYNTNQRRNRNNVDLNRNFPTADWKSDVTMPGGQFVLGGGGRSSLSEPETKALADYTLRLRPRLVLTYHAVASIVTANEAGISRAAAATYASLSGYANEPKAMTGQIFTYDTTGAYEDWLYEQPGIAALLVEMGSMSSSQFTQNRGALWAMLKQ